jgi:DNA-binding response OmpR family regulator
VSHLLLIEDDPIMGESLVDRFELEGLAVLWVRTVAQAELRLREAHFDAVVSDVRLTDGSGEHLFEKLVRAGTVLPPWLFITAFASVDRAVAMLQAGARDYVTKPFDIAELVSKVKGAIGVLEQAASPTDAIRQETRPSWPSIAAPSPRRSSSLPCSVTSAVHLQAPTVCDAAISSWRMAERSFSTRSQS